MSVRLDLGAGGVAVAFVAGFGFQDAMPLRAFVLFASTGTYHDLFTTAISFIYLCNAVDHFP